MSALYLLGIKLESGIGRNFKSEMVVEVLKLQSLDVACSHCLCRLFVIVKEIIVSIVNYIASRVFIQINYNATQNLD